MGVSRLHMSIITPRETGRKTKQKTKQTRIRYHCLVLHVFES